MERIDYISVLGHRLKVIHEPLAESDEVWGKFDSDTMTIHLCDSLTPDRRESVLLHEVIHAALFITGHSELMEERKEEALVLALEHALHLLYTRRT